MRISYFPRRRNELEIRRDSQFEPTLAALRPTLPSQASVHILASTEFVKRGPDFGSVYSNFNSDLGFGCNRKKFRHIESSYVIRHVTSASMIAPARALI